MGWARGTGKLNRFEGKERGEDEGKEGKR